MLSDHGHQVDVINLDYCIHYCPNVERTLEFILRYNLLRPGGLLFLTVARITQANQSRNLGLKTMSTKIERVLEQIESEFKLTGVDRETIDGFPYAYKGEHRNSCPMFSFGWKIYPIKEQQMSNTLNVREKQLIVRLRKSGVGTNVIANAFNVTSGTVSAVLAHDTMRPGLYNTAKKAA
jgi:SAM-dependent methyltransferase